MSTITYPQYATAIPHRSKSKYNWPGWALKDNQHGHEFDEAARDRMVQGGAALVPYLDQFLGAIGSAILEIGPFFNPLTRFIEEQLSYKTITFWENDTNVIQWLGAADFAFSHTVENVDINALNRTPTVAQKSQTLYDSVIASQIFNYIDYQAFLSVLNQQIVMRGLIFINNVVDYGIPAYFSSKRPKSIRETLEQIEIAGFDVIDYDILPTVYPEHQPENRLIVVGQKTR